MSQKLPPLHSVPSLEPRIFASLRAVLPDSERKLLSLVDGRRSLLEILEVSGVDKFALLERMAEYHALGLLLTADDTASPADTQRTPAEATKPLRSLRLLSVPSSQKEPERAVRSVAPRIQSTEWTLSWTPAAFAKVRRLVVPTQSSSGGEPRPSTRARALLPKTRLGEHEVLAHLSEEDTGSLYLVRSGDAERGLASRVCVLELLNWQLGTEEFASFAERSAALTELRDGGWVNTLASGVHEHHPFVIREYTEGARLSELTQRSEGAPAPHLVVAVLLQVLASLQSLHDALEPRARSLGANHGRLSASSILVGSDGVARVSGHCEEYLRRSFDPECRVLGSAYASPEQLLGRPTDRRSDVFSVGVLLWNALTGERLFGSADDVLKLSKKTLAAPSSRGLQPPSCFDAVCMQALESDPQRRFPSAAAMAAELRRVASAAGLLGSERSIATWVRNACSRELSLLRSRLLEPSTNSDVKSGSRAMTRRASRATRAGAERSPARAAPRPSAILAPFMKPSLFDMRRPWRWIAALATLGAVLAVLWPGRSPFSGPRSTSSALRSPR